MYYMFKMRTIRFFSIVIIIIFMTNCKDMEKRDHFYVEGLPSGLTFSSLHFINDSVGYLFCTESRDDGFGDSNPIFKTTNGGRNWQIVNSNSCDSYVVSNRIIANTAYVYRLLMNLSGEHNYLECFSFKEDRSIFCKPFDLNRSYLIDVLDNELYCIEEKNGNYFLNTYDNSLKPKESFQVMPFAQGVRINENFYVISGDSMGRNQLFKVNQTNCHRLPLSYYPEIINRHNGKVFLAGTDSEIKNRIVFSIIDAAKENNEIRSVIDGYTIVRDFIVSEQDVVVVLGKLDGYLVKYDLFHSRDDCRTWNNISLHDQITVSAVTMVNHLVYIYYCTDEIEMIELE